MNIEFDGTQEMLRKIVALKETNQEFTVVCPDCKCEIPSLSVEVDALSCQKCGYFSKLEDRVLSKREQVWKQFNELQEKK